MSERLPRTPVQIICLSWTIIMFAPAIYLSFKFNHGAAEPLQNGMISSVLYIIPLFIMASIYVIFNRKSGIGRGGKTGLFILFSASYCIGTALFSHRYGAGYMFFFALIILWIGSLISLAISIESNG